MSHIKLIWIAYSIKYVHSSAFEWTNEQFQMQTMARRERKKKNFSKATKSQMGLAFWWCDGSSFLHKIATLKNSLNTQTHAHTHVREFEFDRMKMSSPYENKTAEGMNGEWKKEKYNNMMKFSVTHAVYDNIYSMLFAFSPRNQIKSLRAHTMMLYVCMLCWMQVCVNDRTLTSSTRRTMHSPHASTTFELPEKRLQSALRRKSQPT